MDSNGHCKITHSEHTVNLKEHSVSGRCFFLNELNHISPEYFDGKLSYSTDYYALGYLVLKMLVGFEYSENTTISKEAHELIKELRVANPDERLGSNNKSLKDHSFFKSIDWKKLENGELEPPFKPIVVNFSFSFSISIS